MPKRKNTREALTANEARLRLLLSELSHRVKNTLAVVQSIARQTFGGDRPREEALEIFSNRLRALSEAYNLLIRNDWHGASFRELAEAQIGPYTQAGGASFWTARPLMCRPASQPRWPLCCTSLQRTRRNMDRSLRRMELYG
jgi:two-component sensor histidine kinase